MERKVHADRVRVLVEVLIETIVRLQEGLAEPAIGGVLLDYVSSEVEARLTFLEQGEAP